MAGPGTAPFSQRAGCVEGRRHKDQRAAQHGRAAVKAGLQRWQAAHRHALMVQQRQRLATLAAVAVMIDDCGLGGRAGRGGMVPVVTPS